MAANEIQIKITAEGKSASAELRKLKTSMGELEKGATGAKTAGSSLFGAMGPWAIAAAALTAGVLALYKGFKELADVMQKMTSLYATQEAAEKKLQNAMKATGQYTRENFRDLKTFAAELQRLTGVGDEQILNQMALGQVYGLNHDLMKEMTKASLDMATVLSRGGNIAQGMKMSFKILGKVLQDPIKNYATLETYGVRLNKTMMESMTLQEQQAYVMQQVNKHYGGLAMSSDTLSTKLSLLSALWGDLQEKGGEALSVGLKPVLDVINDYLGLMNEKVSQFLPYLQDIAGAIGESLVAGLQIAWEYAERLFSSDAVASLADGIGMIATNLGLVTEGEINSKEIFDIIFGVIEDIINGLAEWMPIIVAISEGARVIVDTFELIQEAAAGSTVEARALSAAIDMAKAAANLLLNPFHQLQAMLRAIKTMIDNIILAARRIQTTLNNIQIPEPLAKAIGYVAGRKTFAERAGETKTRATETGAGTATGAGAELPGMTSPARRGRGGGGKGKGGGGSPAARAGTGGGAKPPSESELARDELEQAYIEWENYYGAKRKLRQKSLEEASVNAQMQIAEIKKLVSFGVLSETDAAIQIKNIRDKLRIMKKQDAEETLKEDEAWLTSYQELYQKANKEELDSKKEYHKEIVKQKKKLQKDLEKLDKQELKQNKEKLDEQIAQDKLAMDKIKETSQAVIGTMNGIFVALGENIGKAIMDSTASFRDFFESLGDMLYDMTIKVITAMQQQAMAKAAASAMSSAPFPANIALAIGAAIKAGAIFIPFITAASALKGALAGLAEGGVIDKQGGIVARIGEAGKEAVIPLENRKALEGLREGFAKMGITSGSSVHIHSPVVLTDNKVAMRRLTRQIARNMDRYQRMYRAS